MYRRYSESMDKIDLIYVVRQLLQINPRAAVIAACRSKNFRKIDFSGLDFSGVDFNRLQLNGADFCGAIFNGTNFVGG